ncbi:MAG: hypothetical protein QOE14_779, partial [Humisphaera sp.]|nr:hypothetical protein [Humisphaera sp.]
APARMLLGRSLEQGGKLDEAAAEYRAAAKLLPHDATVFHALGRALYRQGQSDEAMTSLRFAVRMNPKLPDAHVTLAALLLSQGRAADAIESLRTALSLLPDHVEARAKLADALAQTGEIEQAVVAARAAVQAAPHSAAARSTLLRMLLLEARVTPEELFREHAEWGKIHGAAMQFAFDEHVKWERRTADEADETNRPVAIDKNPDRPLRIGFVSPHFARHPLAKFLIPLLENFDRKQFAVFCYSDAPPGGANDEVTEDFKKLASTWRETARWTDTQFALLVRTDKIDVLVDLTGHGEGNRLLAFGQRPAPVQVTQFGYPFTTGLSAIGDRVSDEITDPPGALDALHSERLVRLAHPAICFRPWERTPARLEARHVSEPITFGCVNDAARLSLQTIQTWAKLMTAVPDARLLVMSSTRDVEATRARLTRLGLEPFRLIVVAPEQGTRYLDLFNQMDILLDTFPCSGGMIAGDALWMATPVVTLAGPMPASRGAALFLNSVGLDDLIAATPGQYIDLAAALANDRKRLEQLAHSLRERLVRSSVCDARACAAAMMDFYRDAWRRYCLMND